MSTEIHYVEIAGRPIASHKVICPKCKVLDLETKFDTSSAPWIAQCPCGWEWLVNPESEA